MSTFVFKNKCQHETKEIYLTFTEIVFQNHNFIRITMFYVLLHLILILICIIMNHICLLLLYNDPGLEGGWGGIY